MVLQIVACLSIASLYLATRIKFKEKLTQKVPFKQITQDYDWKLIMSAVIPTLIIAIGAGFTIPVINLFFLVLFMSNILCLVVYRFLLVILKREMEINNQERNTTI